MSAKLVADPRIGKVIQGRYEVRNLIAEGAMGAVYEGVRVHLDRPVALKFLHRAFAGNVESQRRFEREAVAMSKLSHPHCVSVLDFGFDDGPYIVMELLKGKTVRHLIDEAPIAPARAVSIGQQMLAGLHHAHEKQLVHRDIKPANVLVSATDDGRDHVYVLDFGLAKLTDSGGAQLTEEGIVAGTTSYMSPEHAFGSGIDARSDLYSAGLVLFEMLTGLLPFKSETAAGMLLMHRDRAAPKLGEIREDLRFSEALEETVARALAKDKASRFQTATEFSLALSATPEAKHSVGALTRSLRPAMLAQSGMRGVRAFAQLWRTFLRELKRSSLQMRLAAVVALGSVSALTIATSAWTEARPRSAQPPLKTSPREMPAPQPQAAREPEEPSPDSAIDPTVRARVEQLLMSGELEAALKGLERMVELDPKDAELQYLLGTAYFEVRRWNDGIAAYAAAIEQDSEYRSRPLLNRNTIRALRNGRTREQARTLIVNELGEFALPHLLDSQQRTSNESARSTFQELIDTLSPTDPDAVTPDESETVAASGDSHEAAAMAGRGAAQP